MTELIRKYLAELQAARDAGLFEGVDEAEVLRELLEATISAARRRPHAPPVLIFLDAMAAMDFEIEP